MPGAWSARATGDTSCGELARSVDWAASGARTLLLQDLGPAATLDGLDRFAQTLPGAECESVVCAVVDDAAGEITYSIAGHPPPLVVSAGSERWLDEGHGTLLGLGLGPRPEARAPIGTGDTLVLYTDGLVERRGESLSAGLVRLARAAREVTGAAATTDLGDHLITTLLDQGARDDVALVVHRFVGAEGVGVEGVGVESRGVNARR